MTSVLTLDLEFDSAGQPGVPNLLAQDRLVVARLIATLAGRPQLRFST
jgi:hypothetical protein